MRVINIKEIGVFNNLDFCFFFFFKIVDFEFLFLLILLMLICFFLLMRVYYRNLKGLIVRIL